MITIVHYRNKCIGCYACVEIAPDRWRVSTKDGKCTLVGGELKKNVYTVVVNEIELAANEKAAKICPVKIIRVSHAK